MLASTVQFSNNDQPPTTPTLPRSSLGPATRRHRPQSAPSDTQQRAQPAPRPPVFHAEAVLTGKPPNQPNSQRSTHEPPAPDVRRCTGL
jgi:hypothetical protein